MKPLQITLVAAALLVGFGYAVDALENNAELWASLFWISVIGNVALFMLWHNVRGRTR